mgnify:FL=1
MVLHGTDGSNEVKLECDANGILTTNTKLNTNHTGSGNNHFATCDAQGRTYINSDLGIPINALTEGGANQSLRTDGNGSLRVDTDKYFGAVVSLKNNAGINGAYQFNSSSGDVKKGQRLTLSVRCNSLNTNWTCDIGFSIDGTNWKDTISNINAVPATHQIHSFDVIAPYWRFVFTANDVGQSWTIDYV